MRWVPALCGTACPPPSTPHACMPQHTTQHAYAYASLDLVRLDFGVGELCAHRINGRLVVIRVEDRAARDEHVDARLGDLLDVADADAAVDLERDVVAGLVDELARLARLVERGRDELLAAEAGVDGHEEDDVDLVHDVLEAVER